MNSSSSYSCGNGARCFSLIDAQERNMQWPQTFHYPGERSISRLKAGDIVKVGVEFESSDGGDATAERFWVIVKSVTHQLAGPCFFGTVDNELRLTQRHGLRRGDDIAFEARHIMDIDSD